MTDHFLSLKLHFWPPRLRRSWCRRAGRPWGSAKNASMTQVVVISPLSSSMGTHWALLLPWLAVGGGTTPFYTCSPGALHVGTHAGSSVACHRFEGAARTIHDELLVRSILRVFLVQNSGAVQIVPSGPSNAQLVCGRPAVMLSRNVTICYTFVGSWFC